MNQTPNESEPNLNFSTHTQIQIIIIINNNNNKPSFTSLQKNYYFPKHFLL